MGSVWSTLVNMFLFTLTSLLALSQAQQTGSDWCLDSETGTMMCIAGSKLHQKALDAYQQCSYLAETGSDMPAGRSIFGSVQAKRGVEERQTSDECPPISEMGIAVNDPNPYVPEDSMTDEAKAMKFYGARWDAFQCLTYELSNACQNAFFSTAYTSAWTGEEDGSGSGDFVTV